MLHAFLGSYGSKTNDGVNQEHLNSTIPLPTLELEGSQLTEGQRSVSERHFGDSLPKFTKVLGSLKAEPNDVLVQVDTADNITVPTIWDFSNFTATNTLLPHIGALVNQSTNRRGTKKLLVRSTANGDEDSQAANTKPQTVTSIQISRGKADLHTFSCHLCTFTCKSSEALDKHKCLSMRDADEANIYKCPYPNCRYRCRWKQRLDAHIVYRHRPIEERRFPCPKCSTRCITKKRLINHIKRVHEGTRPLQCTYCPKSFKVYSDLRTHIYTHTGEKPFQCPYCPHRTAQKGAMTCHIARKHGKT